MTLPVILSVPHGGFIIPDEVRDICVLKDSDIIRDSDEGAVEIYGPLKNEVAAFFSTDIARAVIDLNRAEDDRKDDGVVKVHTCWGTQVYSKVPDV